MAQSQGNAPPSLEDAPCPISVEHPLHHCSDRDGYPVRDAKACWAAARREVLIPGRDGEAA